MRLSLILSATNNNCIGSNNKLVCQLPVDMWWFVAKTVGKPIIMGRKTFESIGRPLPHRRNIVLSRSKEPINGVAVYDNLESAIAEYSACPEVMVIGGGEIYKQALPLADRIYLTRIDKEVEGDTFMPDNFLDGFKATSVINVTNVGVNCSFIVYDRM